MCILSIKVNITVEIKVLYLLILHQHILKAKIWRKNNKIHKLGTSTFVASEC